MKKLTAWFLKYKVIMLAFFKPLGIWGVGLLAMIDSGSVPFPIDPIVALYAWNNQSRFMLYCIVASLGSALGSLVPYYVGRAGGELFLLKRINRERYESLRDQFERQEFLAVMIPALMPPPTPIKLFEFSAGVFEMKPLVYAGAIFSGRFIRFTLVSLLAIKYGPDIIKVCLDVVMRYKWVLIAISAAIVILLVVYVKRRVRKMPMPEVK